MAKYGLPNGERTTHYGFGLEDRLASTLLANGTEVKLTYDDLSRVTKRSIGTGYHTTYTYIPAGDGKTTTLLQSIQNGSQTFGYTYDAFGNITAISENGVVKVTYEYDSLNQLTRENNKYLNRTITYNYDAGGNITTKSIWMYTEGNPRAQEDQIAYDYTDANWKDKLTSYKDQAITYDAIGNPLQYRDGMQFSWINGRQLASATSSNGMERYAYNENGIRTAKNFFDKENRYIGRMQFYLDGSTIVAQEYEGETIWFHYDGEGMLAGFDIGGTYYYYLRDGQNNIVGILDSNCNQVVSYQYDSWGKLLSITGSMADTIGVKNPFRYRGYYYDTDTGLYYLQSRYYDPEIGRFINADNENILMLSPENIDFKNLYSYCDNNPIRRRDSYGNSWNEIFIGVTVTAGIVAITALTIATGGLATAAVVGGGAVLLTTEITSAALTIGYVSAGLYTVGMGSIVLGEGLKLYSEHKKNQQPSNKNKHQEGQTRKKRDAGGEKGDARRKPNPNKRNNKPNEIIATTPSRNNPISKSSNTIVPNNPFSSHRYLPIRKY